eukprot:scaffold59442_cov57-Phaeocystis_antarctica.AAC.2
MQARILLELELIKRTRASNISESEGGHLTPGASTPQRTGQAPCRARASARACTRCCSSASSPAEGGPTCCFGAASSCTAREGPPLTFLSLRQQSRRSRWRSRRTASTLHPPTATTPSRCGLLSRPGNSWGHYRNAPPITRASSHAPARTARSRGRARGGAAARTGTAAWGARATHPTRASAGRCGRGVKRGGAAGLPGCSVVPPASPWAGVSLCHLDGGVRAHRPRAHTLDRQVPPAQQPPARLGLARPDRAHLGREHQAVPLPAPFRLCRLLHRLPLEWRAARRGRGQAHLVVAVRPPRPSVSPHPLNL